VTKLKYTAAPANKLHASMETNSAMWRTVRPHQEVFGFRAVQKQAASMYSIPIGSPCSCPNCNKASIMFRSRILNELTGRYETEEPRGRACPKLNWLAHRHTNTDRVKIVLTHV
jgi:hypothetical protein